MDILGSSDLRMAIPFTSNSDAGQRARHAPLSRDQHLVSAARSGCGIAFNKLWDLYSRRVYRTLLGITKSPQDAEDALQDAFFRAFLSLESFEGRANFYTWLTRIAINSALGILRKRRCRPETSLEGNSHHEDDGPQEEFRDLALNPEQIYAEKEKREKLMQAILRLPPEFRKATEARITENCSVKELACRLNISQAAAKSRLYRSRIMLYSLIAIPSEPKTRSAYL